VIVTAGPVRDGSNPSMILVSFGAEQTDIAKPPSRETAAPVGPSRDVEEELQIAREEMRVTIERYETTNEELTAANEEVTSVNEELQATNEELESSKEELQSLNEELSTINSQLDRKIIELAEASDDLRNLLTGNEVATIFLDTELRIKWFSPAIQTLFDLIEKDIGRPVANFTQKFADGNLVEKAKAAIERLATSEQEVRAGDGRSLLRVAPYRTRDNRIAGAVATFIDITDLNSKQIEIAAARDYAEAIVETIRDPLLALSKDLRVISANSAFYETFGISPADTTGCLVYDLVDGQWNIPPLRTLLEELIPNRQQIADYEIEIEVPRLGKRCMMLNARRIDSDDARGELVILALEDVTERRDSARHQELLVGELSHRVKNTLAVVQSIVVQTLRSSDSLEYFSEAFKGRLQALAGANDAIVDGSWKGVTLRHIVHRSLRPFAVDRQVALGDGPDIDLRPQASLALAMILHELATNAVKYGALSVPKGRVLIAWRINSNNPEPRIEVDWTESRGPPVQEPTRRGQGTRFIERSIAYELKGKSSVIFEQDGVRATLTFPMKPAVMPTGAAVPPNVNAV
jgi:two-component system CheB/CheR fusion protein